MSLTRTCRCEATDEKGKACGEFYDPKHGGRCSRGHNCWAETAAAPPPAPRRTRPQAAPELPFTAEEEERWAERDRGSPRPEPPLSPAEARAVGAARRGALEVPRAFPTPTEAPQEVRILRAEDSDELVLTKYPAMASVVIGGLGHGMVHAILGAAGAGKSTVAAQGASAIAERHSVPIWWLDRDQSMLLVRNTFARAQADERWLRVPKAEDELAFGWQQAFALVPQNALVMVVDSLETWAAKSDKARLELLRALRAHGCRFKFVTAAADENDNITGAGELERAWDASIFVHRREIHTGKCRWARESRWERYSEKKGGVRLLVRRIPDPDDELDEAALEAGEDEDEDDEEAEREAAEPEPAPEGARLAARVRRRFSARQRWGRRR